MTLSCPVLPILASAGRLLLEYNESTGEICRVLTSTARALTNKECSIAVSYGGVTVGFAGEAAQFIAIRELRYNAALQARVHSILKQLRRGAIEPVAALSRLESLEAETPAHSSALTIPLLGLAAACLAALLGGDWGTLLTVCVATSLGLVLRHELARRHASLLTLPFAAGFFGAMLGGLAIRSGCTETPQLALIVPSLMLVPGPHLINGLLDLIDNFVPMCVARLTLATSILFAIAMGVALGVELTLTDLPALEYPAKSEFLNVGTDMLLSGVVTLGFAIYYNTAWAHLGMVVAGGMAGHGLRFLALQAGWGLTSATFVGGAAVGIVAALAVRRHPAPIAVMAFAGAVTMMPGVQFYRALSGFLRIVRLHSDAPTSLIASSIGDAFHACLIVSSLALGLIVACRAVFFVTAFHEGRRVG